MTARLVRGARRLGWVTMLAWVVVLAVGAAAFWRFTRTDVTGPTFDDTVRVGVRDGDSVPAYAAASRAELAALPAEPAVYALVTLTGYVAPAGVAPLVAGTQPAYAYARVPLPDRQTELVRLGTTRPPVDLLSAMAAVAERKDAAARTDTGRAAAQTDARLRAIDETDAAVERAEAQAYRAGCACVFALVVRGTPAALRDLAGRPGVRIVDPAPEVRDPAHTVFAAPLPEQTGRVTPPPDTGLPPD
jgi:hypothetical protein